MITANLLYKLYGRYRLRKLRIAVLMMVKRLEGGSFYSQTLRRIFRDFHKVDVGLYSHGGCFIPGMMDFHTRIGRYCSIAAGAVVFNANHPMEFKSTHGFFFNPQLKICDSHLLEYIPLEIGNDVWIGHNAIVMPNVTRIGDGAVIGAGAVVNRDIPPYAVAIGNPARPVRYRFPQEVIDELLASRWWEKSIDELKPDLAGFLRPHAQPRLEEQTVGAGAGDGRPCRARLRLDDPVA